MSSLMRKRGRAGVVTCPRPQPRQQNQASHHVHCSLCPACWQSQACRCRRRAQHVPWELCWGTGSKLREPSPPAQPPAERTTAGSRWLSAQGLASPLQGESGSCGCPAASGAPVGNHQIPAHQDRWWDLADPGCCVCPSLLLQFSLTLGSRQWKGSNFHLLEG